MDVSDLLRLISTNNMIQIFAYLLMERRIVLCSSKLSVLSQCTQGLVALLFPFSWQYIFIPVLPNNLIMFCCAPMPFVIGMMTEHIDELATLKDAMNEVFIFNIDSNRWLDKPEGIDDSKNLPEGPLNSLNYWIPKLKSLYC